MNLQDAGALAWLVPLGGAIVLLYLLRMRRRDVRVPASFLWPEKTEEVRANALIQRLRFSWLLILQLAALALTVLALARPQALQHGLAGEVTVMVIDASASMGATDVQPTRFDSAKGIVASTIRAAKAGDRIALIEAGPTPRVVFPLSRDAAKELTALDTIQRYDSESDMGEAMRLAAALVGAQEGSRIILLSDGCFEPIKNFSRGKAAVVFQQIGKSSHNAAITALGTAETPNGRELYVGVKNFGLDDVGGSVSLYGDGKLLDSEKIVAKSGLQWGKTIPVSPSIKAFEAKLESPDDKLAADNYAATIVDPGATIRVLLVSTGDPFLERALNLDPRVSLDRSSSVPTDTSRYDLVVFDGIEEKKVDSRAVLTFGPVGETSPVTDLGEAKSPTFISAEKKPLMENVDFQGTYIERCRKVKPKPAAEVLAQTTAGPLVVASTKGLKRQVYVDFEPLHSDFPLQVGFPIFIANCLDYLGGTESASMLAIRAGAPFSQVASNSVSLTAPDGSVTQLKPTGGGVVVRNVRQVGKYKLDVDGKIKPVYAYLRSDRESDIAPGRDIQLGGGTVKAQQAPVRFADFWRPLALLTLLVLAGEWWLFARRS